MIIKELKIDSFSGIENRLISFEKGLNVVYGENEKGKSSIEAFIKAMLYGLPSKRGKGDGDRKKYLPFKGGAIKGSMTVNHNNRDYIIQRTFGATKKDDVSVVLDGLTGEEVENINSDEPGKSFLGCNRSTFEKTLFISQLGVAVSKDKEEEIMDKITSLFGCGDDEVPAKKALDKLQVMKKEFVTARKLGYLDKLREKESLLLEERYEAYKLSEKNLEWENQLVLEKENNAQIKEEISKLEVYKKYLKRVNLKQEYRDITEYLKKSEELKRREKEIQGDLGQDIIDEGFIDKLKEENIYYLNLLDRREEINDSSDNLDKILEEKNIERDKYKFLDVFGDGLKDKLIDLKYEQKSLEDKLEYLNKINTSINNEEKELSKRRELLGNVLLIKDIKSEVEDYLNKYEDKLKELKYIAENNTSYTDIEEQLRLENRNKNIGMILIGLGVALSFFGVPILILGLLGIGLGGALFFRSSESIKKLEPQLSIKDDIEKLNDDINNIENKLNDLTKYLGVKDYSELINILRKYVAFNEYEQRTLLRIEEKKNMIKEENYEEQKEKFRKNIQMLTSLKRFSGCDNIDEVLEKIAIYEKLESEIEAIELENENYKDQLNELNDSISNIEVKLKKSLDIMGLDLDNLLDIEIYIKEYKEKIKKFNEIHSNLLSMEETYKALLKDRDINLIKEELKDIINDNNEYSYQSEDEIEVEEKKKSSELIESEKMIKDLENNINNRMIGKRSIIAVEEELQLTKENIKRSEEKLKAIELAIETLSDSFDEIRRSVGPAINDKITANFKELTDNKYVEVKLGENYEMMVNDNSNLFKGNYLSNGAFDQLYLALRVAFVELLFEHEECPIILDDSFVQYDDRRVEKALGLINHKLKGQGIIFTCQKREEQILENNNIISNKIYL